MNIPIIDVIISISPLESLISFEELLKVLFSELRHLSLLIISHIGGQGLQLVICHRVAILIQHRTNLQLSKHRLQTGEALELLELDLHHIPELHMCQVKPRIEAGEVQTLKDMEFGSQQIRRRKLPVLVR